MYIKRNGSQPAIKGSSDNFTGNVRVEPLFQAPGGGEFGGASVTFEPGTQCWGESKEEIRPGDVITCPPDKKHWHGATETTAMTHIAIQASKNGKNVEWLEKVTDEQYRS